MNENIPDNILMVFQSNLENISKWDKNKLYNVGCAKHSDISTFSFHPIKTITTGEGGAITTNDTNLFQKIKLLDRM